jgi:hypothetical protein
VSARDGMAVRMAKVPPAFCLPINSSAWRIAVAMQEQEADAIRALSLLDRETRLRILRSYCPTCGGQRHGVGGACGKPRGKRASELGRRRG